MRYSGLKAKSYLINSSKDLYKYSKRCIIISNSTYRMYKERIKKGLYSYILHKNSKKCININNLYAILLTIQKNDVRLLLDRQALTIKNKHKRGYSVC